MTFYDYRLLLQEVSRIARAPFVGDMHQLREVDGEEETSFFPTLSQQCERGKYALDTTPTATDCDRKNCHKKRRGHYSLSPGLFILLCPHGKFSHIIHMK